jgi:hypothetical protein
VSGVTFDAVGPATPPAATTTNGATSLSWTHVCGSSATYLLVSVSVDFGVPSNFSSLACTYNGVAMTLLRQVVSGDDGETAGFLTVFGLANPSTGSNTVSITGGGSDVMTAGSLSFIGAASIGTVYRSQSGNGGGTTGSVSIPSTTTGNIIAVFVGNGSGFASSPPWFSAPATTEWITDTAGGNGCGASGGAITNSTGSAVSVSWDQNQDWYGAIAIEVQAPDATGSSNMTVTATQEGIGATFNGMALTVKVLTGAAAVSGQTGSKLADTGPASQSLTTTEVGSIIYGAYNWNNGITITPVPGTTVSENYDDETNGATYVTFQSTITATPGPTNVGVTASGDDSTGAWSAAEILPTSTITEDASTPSPAATISAITVTSGSFAPPPGSLLVAMVSTNTNTTSATVSITDSNGLTWTQLGYSTGSSFFGAGVWIANVPTQGGTANSGLLIAGFI